MEELQLIDIADDLVILNKNTIETLIRLDKADDCIALYILYYRLAKWQKTNKIKATNEYVKKTLHWGKEKIIRTKDILKKCGLIEIIQQRNDNKIIGWFIKINYIVSENTTAKIKVEQEVLNQEVLKPTSTKQETIALINNINCLKKEIELLKEENNKLKSLLKESKQESFHSDLFNKFWETYPKKKSKGNVEKWFNKNKPSEELVNKMIDKINLLKETEQWKKNNGQFIPYPTTWLNAKGWEDEIIQENLIETDEEETARLMKEVERRKANGEW